MSVIDRTNLARELPVGNWSVDASRSTVTFAVKHMMLATVKGRFREFEGVLEIGSGAPRAVGQVKAVSIDTKEPVRDKHLCDSPDFFDVEHYPEISFNSTQIVTLNGEGLRILGNLTMRGVTREIALEAKVNSARFDASDDERIELDLHGELSRRDFGLTWNQALETGGALLGNTVKIELEVSAVRAPSPCAT